MTTIAGTDRDAQIEALLADMTLPEKIAQLIGLWSASADGEAGLVAPMQDEMGDTSADFAAFARDGLGQLTRVFGTAVIEPADGMRVLAGAQSWLAENTRHGIRALVHEECLTGLTTWRATAFPGPLSWGASWDPEAVQRMAAAIGTSMAALGVHQGLAPVLDVLRDMRWGRVEETIGEDPYLVGVIGSSYIRGLQSAGVIATAKHFLGYSASDAGRNHAPVHAGPRELADVFALPFEMAVREAGVKSVMHSYPEIDGVPCAADRDLLTGLLRDRWGFSGTLVSDYFGVSFLHTTHHVAADLADAAVLALSAGVDTELPTGRAFLELRDRGGDRVPVPAIDQAVRRVLRHKAELGLLPGTPTGGDGALAAGAPSSNGAAEPGAAPDLDPAEHRQLARTLAEESVILLANDGTLPARVPPRRVAVIGPNGDSPWPLMGGYHFPAHVIPDGGPDLGIPLPTIADAVRAEWPTAEVTVLSGCPVADPEPCDAKGAVAAAEGADLVLLALGDRAGLFGRGTVGEGCDAADLQLPGRQRELAEAVLATGTPAVLVLLSGRGYAVDWATGSAGAIVQAFTPGEEGSAAVLGVISGRVNPSGRLTVSLPTSTGVYPTSYLQPPLAEASAVSTLDPTPAFPFGHGLSYTTFRREFQVADEHAIGEWLPVRCTVTNTGDRPGADVLQLYGRDPVSSVTRPARQLLCFARVPLAPGESATVEMLLPPARFAATGRDLRRVVEPGAWELWLGAHCRDDAVRRTVRLVGDVLPVGDDAPLSCRVRVTRG